MPGCYINLRLNISYMRMLIFQQGKWHDVPLPDYIDPSWGYSQKIQAAHLILKGLSWLKVEETIYRGVLNLSTPL
jgi:hypothetical protein